MPNYNNPFAPPQNFVTSDGMNIGYTGDGGDHYFPQYHNPNETLTIDYVGSADIEKIWIRARHTNESKV